MIAQWQAQQTQDVVEVMACNELTVYIYTRCSMQYVGGMSTVCTGIPMTEVRAALSVCRVPRDQWGVISDGVWWMSAVAAKCINDRL